MAELQDVKQKDRRKRAVRTGPPSQEVRQINTIFKKPRQKAVLLIKDHGSPYHETERTERRKSVGRDGQSGSSLQEREQSQQSQSCPQAFRTCNLSGRCSLASCLKHGLHFQQLPRFFLPLGASFGIICLVNQKERKNGQTAQVNTPARRT